MYKVTIERIAPPTEVRTYPDTNKVFEQIFNDLDISDVAIFLNSSKELSDEQVARMLENKE